MLTIKPAIHVRLSCDCPRSCDKTVVGTVLKQPKDKILGQFKRKGWVIKGGKYLCPKCADPTHEHKPIRAPTWAEVRQWAAP